MRKPMMLPWPIDDRVLSTGAAANARARACDPAPERRILACLGEASSRVYALIRAATTMTRHASDRRSRRGTESTAGSTAALSHCRWRLKCVGSCSLLALLLALPTEATAGEFQVASCQADSLSFSTRAFEDFATRGMQIKRACDPEGPGLRGLVTSNVVRRGRVPRGAVAVATITAPPGTRLTTFRWAGTARRRDCRYALQLYADAPDIKAIPIKNVRANRHCPRPARAQAAGYRARTYNVSGATRIVQRVICVGGNGHRSCSARGLNFVRTYKASVGVVDSLPPAVAIPPDTPLARGEWVSGAQTLNYTATDNVGVRLAQVFIADQLRGSQDRPCSFAIPGGAYADRVPCASGPGQVALQTRGIVEGSQPLTTVVQDAAGNQTSSVTLTARIDNTPPARVDAQVDGGEGWRNRNEWAITWANPAEGDRAPITGATVELCATSGGRCTRSVEQAPSLSRVVQTVPAPGEWTLSLWRRDAAGNEAEDNASVPVTLRYDPEPPQVAFEPVGAADPTLIGVHVVDQVSGLAGGAIEISRAGSGVWQTLPTQQADSRLVARIDDAALPAGTYELRARARDQAGNESSSDRKLDGQPMVVTLPLRTPIAVRVGFEQARTVKRIVRRAGRRRVVRRRVVELRPAVRVPFGDQAWLAGRLTGPGGQAIANAPVQLFSSTTTSPEQLVDTVLTDASGRFRYRASGASTRTLRLAYGGSPQTLPAQDQVRMRVPAASKVRVRPKRVANGKAVTFSGRVRGLPVPASGKLVEVQVRLSGHWQTFRTTRSDQAGRWTSRYRFRRTVGVLYYRFRVRLPREAGYPFETGYSTPLVVRVRGR